MVGDFKNHYGKSLECGMPRFILKNMMSSSHVRTNINSNFELEGDRCELKVNNKSTIKVTDIFNYPDRSAGTEY